MSYALAHTGLEIESCAGGGGRVDLGVIERTDGVWASDCIDPLERWQIVRYTQLLLPPDLICTHVGSAHSHTTFRHHACPSARQLRCGGTWASSGTWPP
jgi:alpha-galactosidase